MRRFVVVGLMVGGLLVSGCSGSKPVQGAQSLQTAPPDSPPEVTSPSETVAAPLPSTSVAVSSVVVSSVAVASSVLKSKDELQIEYVVGEFRRRYWEQIINRTFDESVFDELSEGDQLAANKQSFDQRRTSTKYSKRGTIERGVVVSTEIDGDIAKAISCNQNDIQVWDGKGTDSPADDVLVDGELDTGAKKYTLRKRGETWRIFASQDVQVDCSSAFS
jgi:hypothetical protein